MKHLLFFTYGFWTGGIERLTVDFINYCKNDCNVYVACVQKGGELLSLLEIPNENIFEVGGGILPRQLLDGIKNLKDLKRKLPPELYVISQGEVPNLIVPWVFKKSHYVLVEHNTKTFVNTRGLYGAGLFTYLWAKLSYTRAKKIIAVTDSVKDSILQSLPSKKNNIKIIYNYFDFNAICDKAQEEITEKEFVNYDGVRFVTVGRLFNAKDHITMLKAFQIIIREIDARLFIIGEGEEKKNIEQFIACNNLQNNVFLLGRKTNPYKYMKRADLFLLSSIYEGFPLVLYESLIVGTKVVTTDSTGDMKKNITPDCGAVVAKSDYAAMAEKAIDLIKRKSTRIKTLPEHFKQFRLEYAVAEYFHYFES